MVIYFTAPQRAVILLRRQKPKMNFHAKPCDDAISELSTNALTGLSASEAKARLEKDGKNELAKKKAKTSLQKFFEQFKDVMIIILLVAAVISFVMACIEGEAKEFFEPILILLIVVINAVMGVIQESKAEKALEALQNMSAPKSRVIRDGKEEIIDSASLVVGDIIRLEAGDFVPADARLLKSVNLKSEESALTGESVPSEKDAGEVVDEKAPIGDRTNMIYSGCSITYGTATAVVTATGMNTEMGKIASLLQGESDTQTPLQRKLSSLGKVLGIVAILACVAVFIVGLVNDLDPMDLFMTAVSLAVSAIPEGLSVIVTIVLSIGVTRLAKKNAIIRRLPAVETLGGASIICSDKTGTLTQNRMTLVRAYLDETGNSEDISENNSPEIRKLLTYGTLCCDGTVTFDGGEAKHIGDPTETAIIFAAHKNSLPQAELNAKYERVASLPFDSDRKLMTSVNKIEDKLVVIVKGAFDMMAKRCIAGNLERAREVNDEMSNGALRVLAVGYKIIDTLPDELTSEALESDLILMGLVGMIDPPRPEAKEAVKTCISAGIRPVMITGDHVVTASAIARELGILGVGHRAITGAELDAMSDEELDASVEQISVYARVSPENKIRIVKAWQRKGQIVSMTGDGVNDAPALKAADIGCAMGITGTDVAKGAADMTLADDNFATIVDAVKEGRGIYANIKKVVGFLLGTNIGEIILVLLAMMFLHVSPLLSMQLLLINLVTDSFPAIALGMEPLERDVMQKPPRPKSEGLFAHGYGVQIILQGLMFGLLSFFAFIVGVGGFETLGNILDLGGFENPFFASNLSSGRTLAFMVLALSQVVQAFNMRSERSLFKTGPFGNKTLNKAALGSVAVMLLVMLIPGLNSAFGLVYLEWHLYLIGVAMSLIPTMLMEIAKLTGVIGKK